MPTAVKSLVHRIPPSTPETFSITLLSEEREEKGRQSGVAAATRSCLRSFQLNGLEQKMLSGPGCFLCRPQVFKYSKMCSKCNLRLGRYGGHQ